MNVKVKNVFGIFVILFFMLMLCIHNTLSPYEVKNNVVKEARYNYFDIYTNKTSQVNKTQKARYLDSTNWTLLMSVNDGYFDFFQNWIYFYNKLNINYPIKVIAEDDDVFFKLQQLNGKPVFQLIRSWRHSSSWSVVYGTKGFNKLVSGRPSYILKYLEKGMNILYTDIDSVWLHDPFPFFNGTFDMWMPIDGPNSLCTGLMAIKSNNETIIVLRMWETILNSHLQVNQAAFNRAYKHSKLSLKILDIFLFPSGEFYFKKFSDIKRKHVIIVHNNFIEGHDMKLQRFKKFNFWFSN
jgi:hypothetical protein